MLAAIIEEYFGESYDLVSCPIETYVVVENVVLSVLYRLGINCQVFAEGLPERGWLFEPKNIDNNLQLSLFARTTPYRTACFNPSA